MTPDRWFGVGFCEGARGAGASAAGDALVHDDPKLLIVFCSRAHNLRPLLRQIRERATDAACGDSLAALGGRPPLGLIAFDCVARRAVLGETGIKSEIGRLTAMAPGAPVAGCYTYGEIARTRGVRGFHNQTLVLLSTG